MAEASTTDKSSGKGNSVKHEGDHDRVQMLSLKADGTPDQHNPEIIGDKDAAIRAAQEQFTQQAVSAVDSRNATGGGTTVEGAPQDPSIQKAQDEHEKAAKAAQSAAQKTVESLHKS